MKQQNFKNHSRLVPGYHYVGGSMLLFLLIGSVINLATSSQESRYSASLIVLIAILLFIVTYYARAFALKAQDRAIRAEENFRHYLLTGEPLSSELRMRQIVALRFSSDDEFPGLVNLAISNELSPKEIKKSIKNWKSNTYRV